MTIYTTIQAIATKYDVSKYIANKRYKCGYIIKCVNQRGESVGYMYLLELFHPIK